jgi:hypothetical protein
MVRKPLSHIPIDILSQTAKFTVDPAALVDTSAVKPKPTGAIPPIAFGPRTQHRSLHSWLGHKTGC